MGAPPFKKGPRTVRFNMMLTVEESVRLDLCATLRGLDRSNAVRQLVLEDVNRRAGRGKPRKAGR
jgi:hypothetical protein